MSVVEVRNVSYRYPDGTEALHNVSLTVEGNRRLAILGANGSGKTTLLMLLNGLLLAQSGSVRIFGETVTKKNLRTIRRQVGVLFDNPDNQLFSTTVFDDVAFGPHNMGWSDTDIRERSEAALESLGIRHLAEKPPHNLSLGQKKKAAIAGLLSMNLTLFVMDEPFSGLDPTSVAGFFSTLDELHRKGCTQIISTHDIDLAYGWADEIAIVDRGRIIAVGNHEILHDERLLNESRLCLPTLVRIFTDTPHRPRTLQEAQRKMTRAD